MSPRYAREFSVKELQACFLARDLEDGSWMGVGQNSAIARAAVLLAHFTHAPNMIVRIAYTTTNLLAVPEVGYFELESDQRAIRWAESLSTDEENVPFNKAKNLHSRFFIGGLQVDEYGNTNLIGVGPDYKHLRVRGPGGVHTPGNATAMQCYYIIVNNHDKRTFVKKVDYITAFGWGSGGADARKKIGLPGGGPKYCVTPLCIMDFEEETKRMRLKSIHPGVTVQQVLENTGFEPVIPKDVPYTEAPLDTELQILRTRIDAQGVLRR